MQIDNSKKNLVVMFGGISPEHEVSVITGMQVCQNADSHKYNVIPVYISKKGKWYFDESLSEPETYTDMEKIELDFPLVTFDINKPSYFLINQKGLMKKALEIKVDTAFLAFHGGHGESGQIQGLLDVMKIPYTSADVLGSSIGMDKVIMKQVLQQNGIKVAPYEFFYKTDWENNKIEIIKKLNSNLVYPLFVKPANAGSSIGISKVKDEVELENAIEVALSFDRKVIVETGIVGYKEINISLIGTYGDKVITSVCEEVYAKSDFLNFDDKYVGGGKKSQGMASADRKIPAELSEDFTKQMQTIAEKAFHALNAGGLVRIDFLVNPETQDYVLIEINTIPGSVSFYLWEPSGLPFKDMIDKAVENAVTAFELRNEKITSFKTNILRDFKSSQKAPKLG